MPQTLAHSQSRHDGGDVELETLGDDLDHEARARLHGALDAAADELRAEKGIAGRNIIAALRHRCL
jgi:hypothetical protein